MKKWSFVLIAHNESAHCIIRFLRIEMHSYVHRYHVPLVTSAQDSKIPTLSYFSYSYAHSRTPYGICTCERTYQHTHTHRHAHTHMCDLTNTHTIVPPNELTLSRICTYLLTHTADTHTRTYHPLHYVARILCYWLEASQGTFSCILSQLLAFPSKFRGTVLSSHVRI